MFIDGKCKGSLGTSGDFGKPQSQRLLHVEKTGEALEAKQLECQVP